MADRYTPVSQIIDCARVLANTVAELCASSSSHPRKPAPVSYAPEAGEPGEALGLTRRHDGWTCSR
jgi:hypothetical protein